MSASLVLSKAAELDVVTSRGEPLTDSSEIGLVVGLDEVEADDLLVRSR